MKKPSKRERRRKTPLTVRAVTWAVVIGAVALTLYAISQNAGVAFDEDDIRVVDFSSLSETEKRSALQAANLARCTCGCGMNLAQCVSTDMTCPVRETNIQTIRKMARDADRS